jgi:hypothetical protein
VKHAAACLATLAALAASGCAALVQDDWHAQANHPALPPRHIEVASADLARVCGQPAGMIVYGCAIRVFEPRLCLVYTPPNSPAWVMAHELRHCAGWDHGDVASAARTSVAAASWATPP